MINYKLIANSQSLDHLLSLLETHKPDVYLSPEELTTPMLIIYKMLQWMVRDKSPFLLITDNQGRWLQGDNLKTFPRKIPHAQHNYLQWVDLIFFKDTVIASHFKITERNCVQLKLVIRPC